MRDGETRIEDRSHKTQNEDRWDGEEEDGEIVDSLLSRTELTIQH
jgi:hypothetical protein